MGGGSEAVLDVGEQACLPQECEGAQRELTMKRWIPPNPVFLVGASIDLHDGILGVAPGGGAPY